MSQIFGIDQFELPSLHSRGQLIDWLGIDERQLKWLANPTRGSRATVNDTSRHYHSRWIRKRTDGWRLIESPKPLLKSVQRRILSEILGNVLPHPLAFGFCKGRNVIGFGKPHVNRDVCLKMDLRDFFPSVNAGRVTGWFRNLGYHPDVAHALSMLTTVQTSNLVLRDFGLTNYGSPGEVCRRYAKRHLPQGAPTSPALANLCAYRLDCRLAGFARKTGGVHYTRYADDLLFSGYSSFRRQVPWFQTVVGAIALEEGFEMNFRKSQIMLRHHRQRAAGMVLNQRINIERREFDRLKAILHNCVVHGAASQNREKIEHFEQHLQGRIAWVAALSPSRGEKLRQTFSKIDFSGT